ncbi:MAG: glycosyltransferase [Nitrospirae bacterium]|nr:glycosyltransferase [Nitrospirota bacterium]
MKAQDSLDIINEIEAKLPVDQWVIDDIHIWPVVRIHIFSLLRDLSLQSTGQKSERKISMPKYPRLAFGYMKGFLRYARAFFADLRHNAVPSSADVIFLGDQVSRILIHGKWYDKLCEPIIDYLEKRRGMRCFHMDPGHKYRIPRHNRSMFIQANLDKELIRSAFIYRENEFVKGLSQEYGIVLEMLRSRCKDINPPSLISISKNVSYIRSAAEFFGRVLRRVNPSLAFLVEYYGQTGLAFNLACRRYGIRTVEIPHGNHGNVHVAYSRWNKLPERGYELLPSIFWCWSDAEANMITKWSNNYSEWHKPIVGGNPWLNIWKCENNEMIRSYDEKIVEIKNSSSSQVHVLCTYEFDYEDLLKIIKESPNSWFWWIRVHPCRLGQREQIRRLLKRKKIVNCDLDNATDMPLYALLKRVDVHLTEYSSTVIESESFCVPSVITRKAGADAFSRQVESGWAVAVYTIEEIVKGLEYQIKRKPALPVTYGAMEKCDLSIIDSLLALF